VGWYQKGKTNLDFTEARDSEWQWHQRGICKSAPRSRQITMPAPHHSVFTGRMPFLPPNQQRQSTEGTYRDRKVKPIWILLMQETVSVAVAYMLGYMQVCTSLQTDNHASTPPLSFLQAACTSCCATNSDFIANN